MGINKVLQKQKNYGNFLNKLSKNSISINNYLLVLLIVNIIFVLFHSLIIYYLANLKKCLCFQKLNKENYSNINYLIIIETLTLIPFVISFIGSLILYLSKNIKKGGGKNNINIKSYYTVFYIAYGIGLLINTYFLYNVKKLAENVKKDCECSHNWIRYLLYIYSIYMVFIIISGIITLFFIN